MEVPGVICQITSKKVLEALADHGVSLSAPNVTLDDHPVREAYEKDSAGKEDKTKRLYPEGSIWVRLPSMQYVILAPGEFVILKPGELAKVDPEDVLA